jgi:hypothetical protein
MFPYDHCRLIGLATAAALVVLAGLSIPASTDELTKVKGPVEFHEPILGELGDKRVIAYYEADRGQCGINVVVWNRADETGDSRIGLRVNLSPRQMIQVDTPDNKTVNLKSLNLQCGDYAEGLSIVDTSQPKLVKASASDF